MLVDVIAYGVLVSALLICILAKSERSAQTCAGLVLLLVLSFILQDHIQVFDRLFNKTVTIIVGITILVLAITAVVRLKDKTVGAVLITLSALLAGVMTGFF